jgi:hypothetical protein
MKYLKVFKEFHLRVQRHYCKLMRGDIEVLRCEAHTNADMIPLWNNTFILTREQVRDWFLVYDIFDKGKKG